MNLNFNPFDADFTEPGFTFLKSTSLLMIGTFLEGLQGTHLPPVFIEIAKVLAYLGASVAFFKFIGAMMSGTPHDNK
jgi:hypothetical protein